MANERNLTRNHLEDHSMGKELAMDTAQPLSLSGVLGESLHLPKRNAKLMVSNTLLVLIPFSILALIHNLIAGPFLIEVEDHEPNDGLTSNFQKHVRILMVLEATFFLVFCILSIFAMATTVYASSATYAGKYLSLKDVFTRTVATWRRPVITSLYIALVTISYACFAALPYLGFFLMAKDSRAISITWIWLVGVFEMLLYLYLAAVCLLGLVVSIVEEDCYGFKALEKAQVLIKGRKLQAYFLMLFSVLLSAPIWALFSLNAVEDEIGTTTQAAMGIVEAALVCLMKLFTFVVYTVLYHQCKRSSGEKEGMEEETRYRLVSTNLHVNDSLP